MASISKRQQARNERALHELIQRVPGNNTCADCSAVNPAWASWSLGIFLCIRCASLHRKLGTHISKVKSLSMDTWSSEQVENMKKVGNTASNKIYNPKAKKPPVPVDADEADSAMERFIRAKYVSHNLNGARKYDVGSSLSDNETPPPPPPKTGKFGLRSASSLFPLSSKAKKQAAAAAATADEGLSAPREPARSPSPHLMNKPSKVFGASIEYDSGDTESKLVRLRDMGFTDHSRNITVLKGVNGSFERAVETLVRLGEGASSLAAPRDSSLRATRSLTPLSPRPATCGNEAPVTPSSSSTNPFDMLTPQPQTAQSTGTLQNKNPYLSSTNPFGAPGSSHSDHFSQAFQNMSLAPPHSQPQPLFPNHTGGVPAHLPQQGYLQPSSVPTPPVPSLPFNPTQTYPQPQYMPQQQQPQQFLNGFVSASPQPMAAPGHNPFFTDQNQQQPLAVNTASPQLHANNPFTRSPTRLQSPALGQIPEQSQYVAASPAAHPNNPWYTPPQPQQMPTSQRPNNASILALYNHPHYAPQPQQMQQQQQQQQQPQPHPAQEQQPPAAPTAHDFFGGGQQQQPRSVSTPLSGGKNPFFATNGATSPPAVPRSNDPFGGGVAHSSRDSIALGLDMANWSNGGRHSPDAFASLSARHG